MFPEKKPLEPAHRAKAKPSRDAIFFCSSCLDMAQHGATIHHGSPCRAATSPSPASRSFSSFQITLKKVQIELGAKTQGGKKSQTLLLIICLPSISLLAPSPARLHPGEPAAACRRKRPCHGCLRCVIVSVTLQIPFPCGGPGGVINGEGRRSGPCQ